jgi:hypothetical protein
MSKYIDHPAVDLSESSIYGKNSETSAASTDDTATEAALDRLEEIRGGAGNDPQLYKGATGRAAEALDASTDEEIDALQVNLLQDDNIANSRDGSGRIVDDVAEEQLAEFTETGPDLDLEGALSVTPGRDDTSSVIRRHHPNAEIARTESIVEGNLDKPSDETRSDPKVDQGTGA